MMIKKSTISKKLVAKELLPRYPYLKFITRLLMTSWGRHLITFQSKQLKSINAKGLNCSEVYIPSRSGGPDIRVRIIKPLNCSQELPGLLYIHGGGYMVGVPEIHFKKIQKLIEKRPCIVVAPDYRKSIKDPYPAGFNDCFDTLLWMQDNAKEKGMLDQHFIVGGTSAGGGLTAAVSLKARDTKQVKIAFQMPIYPMIDDREITPSSQNMPIYPWNSKANKIGWELYLKNLRKNKQEIPIYAAAARAKDFNNLPPTITFVGDLEPFLDETINYVNALKDAGVHVIFKCFKGCYHAFDSLVPKAKISQKAHRFLLNAYAEFYDRYV